MLDRRVGFIGAGNMARAIIEGMLKQGLVQPGQIFVSDVNAEQVQRLAKATGINPAASNSETAASADVLIIATKPQHVAGVMAEIRDSLSVDRNLVISICAGVTTASMEAAAGIDGLSVIRVMPNTPALIGCGSAGIAAGSSVTDAQLSIATQIFDSVGTSVVVAESKLDAVTGVTGSGPAYVFRFIELLIEAGVQQGLTREEVQALVPQMVLGAARMAVEDGRTLEELRQAVTTPGGTTAAGLAQLEERGFADLVARCVAAATARSRELAGN